MRLVLYQLGKFYSLTPRSFEHPLVKRILGSRVDEIWNHLSNEIDDSRTLSEKSKTPIHPK